MPWQSAPAFGVICGAFAATGFGLSLVDKIAYGKNRRVQIDEWVFQMDLRDEDIKREKSLIKIPAVAVTGIPIEKDHKT